MKPKNVFCVSGGAFSWAPSAGEGLLWPASLAYLKSEASRITDLSQLVDFADYVATSY